MTCPDHTPRVGHAPAAVPKNRRDEKAARHAACFSGSLSACQVSPPHPHQANVAPKGASRSLPIPSEHFDRKPPPLPRLAIEPGKNLRPSLDDQHYPILRSAQITSTKTATQTRRTAGSGSALNRRISAPLGATLAFFTFAVDILRFSAAQHFLLLCSTWKSVSAWTAFVNRNSTQSTKPI